MYLSLYILADWLAKYHPVLNIQDGRPGIQNVRPLTSGAPLNPDCLYIGISGDENGKTLCIHRKDLLILDTADTAQVLSDILDAFDFYNNWHNCLQQDLPYIGIQEIIDRSTAVLDRLIMVSDASYYVVAYTQPEDCFLNDPSIRQILSTRMLDTKNILAAEKEPHLRQKITVSYPAIQPVTPCGNHTYARNLFNQDRQWGWLLAVGTEPPSRSEQDIQNAIAVLLEHWIQFHQEQSEKWEQSGVFLEILDNSFISREHLEPRIQALGWENDEVKRLYLIPHAGSTGLHDAVLLRQVEQFSPSGRSRTFFYKENLVTVLCGNDYTQKCFQKAMELFLERINCHCGISPAFSDLFALKQQYTLAFAAVSCAPSSSGRLCGFDQAALPYAITLLADITQPWFIHPAVTQLIEYDQSHETEFCKTLSFYLKAERSLVRTAELMHLHRNTLLYRIQRISELTELNLEEYETRLRLILSFEILGI